MALRTGLLGAQLTWQSGTQSMTSQQSGIGAGVSLAKTAKIAKEEKGEKSEEKNLFRILGVLARGFQAALRANTAICAESAR